MVRTEATARVDPMQTLLTVSIMATPNLRIGCTFRVNGTLRDINGNPIRYETVYWQITKPDGGLLSDRMPYGSPTDSDGNFYSGDIGEKPDIAGIYIASGEFRGTALYFPSSDTDSILISDKITTVLSAALTTSWEVPYVGCPLRFSGNLADVSGNRLNGKLISWAVYRPDGTLFNSGTVLTALLADGGEFVIEVGNSDQAGSWTGVAEFAGDIDYKGCEEEIGESEWLEPQPVC